jgi:hypothetical protein
MKHLKLYEQYNKKYNETALEFVNKWYSDETNPNGPYGDYSEILNRVNDFCTNDIPYGINNLPDTVTLYRLLNVDNIDDINKNALGKYYVGSKSMFKDEAFLDSFFYRYGEEVKKWFIVTIQTSKDNIDIHDSLANRAEYPDEYQITIKDDSLSSIKIIDIEETEVIYA